jgi:murein DD-endopeptidase MepM/ murein hydrolase activator NlpD
LLVHALLDLIDAANKQEDPRGDAGVFVARFFELAGDVGEAGEGEQDAAAAGDMSNMVPTSYSIFGGVTPGWGKNKQGVSYYEGGAHKGRELGNWESDNAWDIFAKAGTPVYAIAPGVVSLVRKGDPNAKTVVYGDQISVKGSGETPSIFYTHIDTAVAKGKPIRTGDLIGRIIAHPNMEKMPHHVHVGIDRKIHIKRFLREDGTILGAAPLVASAEKDQQKKGDEKKTG